MQLARLQEHWLCCQQVCRPPPDPTPCTTTGTTTLLGLCKLRMPLCVDLAVRTSLHSPALHSPSAHSACLHSPQTLLPLLPPTRPAVRAVALAAAVPVGAGIGAAAVGLDSVALRRRQRRAAARRPIPAGTATNGPSTAAANVLGVAAVPSPARAAAAKPTATPAPAASVPGTPELPRSITPQPLDGGDSPARVRGGPGLPPLNLAPMAGAAKDGLSDSTNALRKSLSKSLKSFKRAMSSSGGGDDAPRSGGGRPPSGLGDKLRASFGGGRDTAPLADGAVERSEGSGTVRKMKDLLRRSLTLSTPRTSLDGRAPRAA